MANATNDPRALRAKTRAAERLAAKLSYEPGQRVKVRAVRKGFDGLRLWNPGQVFVWTVDASGKLPAWVVPDGVKVADPVEEAYTPHPEPHGHEEEHEEEDDESESTTNKDVLG